MYALIGVALFVAIVGGGALWQKWQDRPTDAGPLRCPTCDGYGTDAYGISSAACDTCRGTGRAS